MKMVPMSTAEQALPLHRHHILILATPFVVFLALFFMPWNPIYPGIIAMFAGAAATLYCRPDLKRKTWIGAGLFVIYYAVFLQGLRFTAVGYIAHVWNLNGLLGIEILGLPVEELLFAAGFGLYWSGVYEHFTWRQVASDACGE
jgi:Lycopene cyclase